MVKEILTRDNLETNVSLGSKEEAIRFTGEILVKQGYIEETYIDKMLEREQVTSTFIGNSVAIPHGTEDTKSAVKETGLSLVTIPDGVDFNGNTVKLLIGIAGRGDEHLELLSQIAKVCSEEEKIEKILNASSEKEIISIFEGEVN